MAFWWRLSAIEIKSVPDGIHLPFTVKNTPLSEWYYLAWGFLEPLQMILIQERADIKYLGRITGFVRFGLMSAGVVPLLAAPFLAEALGVQTVLFGASTIIALVGTLFFVTQGRRRGR